MLSALTITAQYGESIDDAYEMSFPESPRDYGTVNYEDRQNELAPLATTSLEYDNTFESRIESGYDNNFELNSGHLDIPTGCQPDNSHPSLGLLGSSPGDQREDTNQMEQCKQMVSKVVVGKCLIISRWNTSSGANFTIPQCFNSAL